MVGDKDTRSCQAFLALMEIMDCVVHRQKPTLRIQPGTPESLDYHLGLCLPLLQCFYDICDINYALRTNADSMCSVHAQKRLDEIRQVIEDWQPSICGNLIGQCKTTEVVNLLAQTRVFRLSGLLLIHRSRYIFNQQDDQADTWSKEILMELELAHRVTKQTIQCATLPFVVAAVEIQDPNARLKVLQNVDNYVDQFTPLVKEAIKTFLQRVWLERDSKTTVCWLDSISKPCVVLKSIYATCVD